MEKKHQCLTVTCRKSKGRDEERNTNTKRCLLNSDRRPLDGGWGWCVVLGCSVMHLLVAGFSRSYGVIYVQLQERFHSNAAITAWVGGTCTALRMGLSPIATSLSTKFGARPVIFSGGLLVGLGCLVSAFTPSTEFMFFSYAILTGVGGTLAYAPSLVLVGQYFEKYRSIAVGLGSAGSGIGVFSIPPVMNAMFGYYGYTGTLLIIGAVMLHVCVSGALHRPLEANRPPPKRSQSNDDNADLESDNKNADPSKEGTDNEPLKVTIMNDNFSGQTPQMTADDKQHLQTSTDKPVKSTGQKHSCFASLTKYLDLSLCANPVFLVYILAMGFHTLSYMAGQMLVPAMAQSRGHTRMSSVLLLSYLGIADFIGRTSSGFIFDISILKKHRTSMYNLCIFIAGSCHLMWAFCIPYAALVAACLIHGLFNGCVVSQRAVILSDLLGVDKLSSSFGLTVFIQGCGIMVGPAIAGVIRDVSGDYVGSYIFTYTSAMVGALMFCFSTHSNLWCCSKLKVLNNKETGPNTHSAPL